MADSIPIQGIDYHAGYLPDRKNQHPGKEKPDATDPPPTEGEPEEDPKSPLNDITPTQAGVGDNVDLEA